MFYLFDQDNIGGSFTFDENRGITNLVIIEADKASHANQYAKEIGICFGDYDYCSGRWDEVWEEDGEEFPTIYGTPIQDFVSKDDFRGWMEPGKEVCVHYKDGRKEWF